MWLSPRNMLLRYARGSMFYMREYHSVKAGNRERGGSFLCCYMWTTIRLVQVIRSVDKHKNRVSDVRSEVASFLLIRNLNSNSVTTTDFKSPARTVAPWAHSVENRKLQVESFRTSSNLRPATFNRVRAGDGIRTRGYQLGRLMPYHLATPACERHFTTRNHPRHPGGRSCDLISSSRSSSRRIYPFSIISAQCPSEKRSPRTQNVSMDRIWSKDAVLTRFSSFSI